tara:strand:- start:1266 stop:1823 length:558 start_codon:yes stop_codon:yes gene_type:complete
LVKKRVIPGDFLSTEEEFEPGQNAFIEEGSIRSDSIGTVVENTEHRTISVEKTKNVIPIKKGDIVFGEVGLVRDSSVILYLSTVEADHTKKVLSVTRASLPIRMVSRDYVKHLKELFKIGDLVKAKIAFVAPYGIDVRTDEPELGVIRAFCAKCRKPLQLFGSQLKCLGCGDTGGRKFSTEYSLK